MSKPLIQFRPYGLENFFANRNKENANHIARTALTRYDFLIQYYQENEVLQTFSRNELLFVFDALNGTDFTEAQFLRYLPDEVMDCDEWLFVKWEISSTELEEKLRNCNIAEFITLIDMKERFFAGTLQLEAEKTNAPNLPKN